MRFYIDGCRVSELAAYIQFRNTMLERGEDPDALRDYWRACIESEDARDCMLPSEIELIPGI